MTHSEFWSLYDNGTISTKVYSFEKENKTTEIVAFEYSGKFYLRICNTFDYSLDRTAECGKKYRMHHNNSFIKEFNNKTAANKYFTAVKNGN